MPAYGKEMICYVSCKKGFIVYFNNYPLLTNLPMEQRGLLFSALMIYADRVWRDPSVSLDEVLEGFPQLSPEARMACGFMGTGVQRDTEAWLSKQEYRTRRRQEPAGRGRSADPKTREEERNRADQRAREDMERIQRMMERLGGDA